MGVRHRGSVLQPPWLGRSLCVVAAAAIWLSSVHLLFRPGPVAHTREGALSPTGEALLTRQLRLWEDPGERARAIEQMRASNAEWDFMGRTFLVLALGNMAERRPEERERYVAVIDRIIDETVLLERERGMFHFLMPYASQRPFVVQPPRSAFVDGEIALMLATRELVLPRAGGRQKLAERTASLRSQMESSTVLSAESYPDECWTFCNTMALAAMRMEDAIVGGHRGADLARRWLERARAELVDPETGLLVSSFTVSGRHLDGPEGSSIWVASHALMLVDEAFARDQYERARRLLGVEFMGFGWAREWPRSSGGRSDVDSGPIVPIVDASPGSSGLALLGASAFGDDAYLTSLLTTLDFAGFPTRRAGALRYAASNQVGDAALVYALSFGPLWHRVMHGEES
jgi:hypothetical protein